MAEFGSGKGAPEASPVKVLVIEDDPMFRRAIAETLRRQGIIVTKIKKQRAGSGGKVSEKDVTLFTRQMATMMKAGVPLLQAFDIVGKGATNPAVARLLAR